MEAYFNGRIFNGEKFLKNACILTANNKIIKIVDDNSVPINAEKINLQGHILAPALIDLQIYGGNGQFFGEFPSVQALEATYNYCVAGGAAHFMPTVATHSEAVMFKAIDAVKLYWEQGGKGVLGLHLEGPYLNIKKRGAHLKQFIKHFPSIHAVQSILEYGKGIIKVMTIAPEIVSDEVIELLQKYGVTISLGHSNATFIEAKAAFSKGATICPLEKVPRSPPCLLLGQVESDFAREAKSSPALIFFSNASAFSLAFFFSSGVALASTPQRIWLAFTLGSCLNLSGLSS